MAGALIVTAEFAAADFAWLDALRRAHYPIERNRLPAHLTLLHAVAPSAEAEVRTRLAEIARGAAPPARIGGVLDLGGGVALRLVSRGLEQIRGQLAADLHGLLGAQDRGGWRPHVTIQNKVAPREARALKARLEAQGVERRVSIRGLALDRYRDGPWERVAAYPFRGL